jgi:PIN domain nuclease of toxin-antitoxin system
MTGVLLDTHVLLWALDDSPRLGAGVALPHRDPFDTRPEAVDARR